MDAEVYAKRLFFDAEELEVAATKAVGEEAVTLLREAGELRIVAERILTGQVSLITQAMPVSSIR